jgi:hypothetical protein
VLFKEDDSLLKLVDVGGSPESPGLVPRPFTKRLGESTFELLYTGSEANGALLGVEEVGLQGRPADRCVVPRADRVPMSRHATHPRCQVSDHEALLPARRRGGAHGAGLPGLRYQPETGDWRLGSRS